MSQVDVQSEAEVEELQGILGLALQLDLDSKHQPSAAASLHLPCQAPFTSMVPETMRITHRCRLKSNCKEHAPFWSIRGVLPIACMPD